VARDHGAVTVREGRKDMRNGHNVTFGGSARIDRAALQRIEGPQFDALFANPAARVLPVWRGRPLVTGASRNALGWLPPAHPALAGAGLRVFLGLVAGAPGTAPTPRFAVDLSAWQPAGVDSAATVAFFDTSEQPHPALPTDHRFTELRGVMVGLSPEDAELAATARALLAWHESHGFCSRCGAESAAAAAGWQRLCPACGAHHFPRTDPVVIMLVLRGNRVLMGRSHGWPEGMYSLLAGFVEPGETVEAAVRREVREEAGIGIGAVEYLTSQPWPFPASLMLGCRAEALEDDLRIDPVEIEDALWITREEMVEVMTGRHPRVKPARRGAIAHFLVSAWLADQLD